MRLIKNTTHGPRVTINPLPDGVITEFTASHGIEPGTEETTLVFMDGQLQHEGSGYDYVLGAFQEILKVKFVAAPNDGVKLTFVYFGIGGG